MEIVIDQIDNGKMCVADFVNSLSEQDAKMLLNIFISSTRDEVRENAS